jgi:hypothetical protein
MRHFVLLAIGVLVTVVPAAAQQNNPPAAAVCAPDLRGTVRLGEGHPLPRAKVQLLLGAEQRPYRQTMTDPAGRFRLPVGRAQRGSQWLLRIFGPGSNTSDVQVSIDPHCGEAIIRLNPSHNANQ